MSLRRCTKCLQEYPETPEYFHRNTSKRGGLQSWCKTCKKALNKRWAISNKQRMNAATKAWRKAHPDRVKAKNHRRRARSRSAGGSFTEREIQNLFTLQKGRCWWNTKHRLDKGYHIDHRIPLAKGGTNDISNIVLACPFCNLSKGDKLPEEFTGRLL